MLKYLERSRQAIIEWKSPSLKAAFDAGVVEAGKERRVTKKRRTAAKAGSTREPADARAATAGRDRPTQAPSDSSEDRRDRVSTRPSASRRWPA